MSQFVCVRLVQVNELPLSVFQFDHDLTFLAFFLNADGTIYGRYGTRSDFREAEREMSLAGLEKALRAALGLHRGYPANKALLAGKTGPKPRYAVLTDYAWIKAKPNARNKNFCMNCHHIRAAERMTLRTAHQPLPDTAVFPWPLPDVVGLRLDPGEKAKVQRVLPGSPAARAAFRAGDEILTFDGQAILSIADVQWVLHNAPRRATLKAEVLRDGKTLSATLLLEGGWRRKAKVSWRPTTGMLRMLALGGLWLEELPAAGRRRAGLGEGDLALRVGRPVRPVTVAFKAGFRRGDILVSYDGRTRRMTEGQLLAHALQKAPPAEPIPVTVLRAGRRIHVKLPVR
jgi:hypothetical protein